MTTPSLAPDASLHGSAVAFPGPGGPCAVLILGPSGAGKSTLALALTACGGTLVADDRVRLRAAGGRVLLSAPAALRGLVEARGVGVLRVPNLPHAPLALVLDLADGDADRLPPQRSIRLLGRRFERMIPPVNGDAADLAPALAARLRAGGGRVDPAPPGPEGR
ncbi:MAG: serine kinase [Pseudomonadota bacterium]